MERPRVGSLSSRGFQILFVIPRNVRTLIEFYKVNGCYLDMFDLILQIMSQRPIII